MDTQKITKNLTNISLVKKLKINKWFNQRKYLKNHLPLIQFQEISKKETMPKLFQDKIQKKKII